MDDLIFGAGQLLSFRETVAMLRAHEQRKVVQNIIYVCDRRYLRSQPGVGDAESLKATSAVIGGVISLVSGITDQNEQLIQHLRNVLLDSQGQSATFSTAMRRVMVATLGDNEGMNCDTLEARLYTNRAKMPYKIYLRRRGNSLGLNSTFAMLLSRNKKVRFPFLTIAFGY
jgi:hypothetical protein